MIILIYQLKGVLIMKNVLKQISISLAAVSGLTVGFILLMHLANLMSALGF